MTTKRRRRPADEGAAPGGTTNRTIKDWVSQFSDLKHQKSLVDARMKSLRDSLMDIIEQRGFTEGGHLYFELGEEVAGFRTLKREARVSRAINEDRAEKLLRSKGLWEDVTEVVRVLDDDKLRLAIYEGKLTQEEFDSLVDERTTYALKMLKT